MRAITGDESPPTAHTGFRVRYEQGDRDRGHADHDDTREREDRQRLPQECPGDRGCTCGFEQEAAGRGDRRD